MAKLFLIISISILSVAGLLWFGMRASVAGIETPAYTVEKRDGDFEIRKYPTLVAAATASENQNSGFRTLFKYISGENKSDQKIAMTSPVLMPASSHGETQEMMFLVPEAVVGEGVPEPSSKTVTIKKVNSGRFAVIRSKGRLDDSLRKKLLTRLRSEIAKRKLKTTGNPIYAGYDPPWTPGPLRLNEVMIRLK